MKLSMSVFGLCMLMFLSGLRSLVIRRFPFVFSQTLITFVNKHLNKLNLEVSELDTQVRHAPPKHTLRKTCSNVAKSLYCIEQTLMMLIENIVHHCQRYDL